MDDRFGRIGAPYEGDDPDIGNPATLQLCPKHPAQTGGRLEPHELQAWRLLHAPPQPYTRERFEDTYNWTVKWNMVVPGATFENTVDNRAWK